MWTHWTTLLGVVTTWKLYLALGPGDSLLWGFCSWRRSRASDGVINKSGLPWCKIFKLQTVALFRYAHTFWPATVSFFSCLLRLCALQLAIGFMRVLISMCDSSREPLIRHECSQQTFVDPSGSEFEVCGVASRSVHWLRHWKSGHRNRSYFYETFLNLLQRTQTWDTCRL